MIYRYPLSYIAGVLADVDHLGSCHAAAKQHGLAFETVRNWHLRRLREHTGWPTEQDIQTDIEYRTRTAKERAHHAAQLQARRHHLRTYGPLKTDATGTVRRIRALHALGWTGHDLAQHLGVSKDRISQLAVAQSPMVLTDTRDAVVRLYDRLSMTVPTHNPPWLVARTRRTAARKGWAPPLAYDDDELDDPQAVPRGMDTAA